MSTKFELGDRVCISNFPEEIYEVLNIRQLPHDREPHYCLQEPLIWVSESSLQGVVKAAIAKSRCEVAA
jgi:hypothetical protein